RRFGPGLSSTCRGLVAVYARTARLPRPESFMVLRAHISSAPGQRDDVISRRQPAYATGGRAFPRSNLIWGFDRFGLRCLRLKTLNNYSVAANRIVVPAEFDEFRPGPGYCPRAEWGPPCSSQRSCRESSATGHALPCIRREGGHMDQRFHASVAVGPVGDDRAAVGMTDENDRVVNRIAERRYVGGIAAHTAQRVRSRDHLVSLGEQQSEDRFPVGQRLSECAMHQNYGDCAWFSHGFNSLDQLNAASTASGLIRRR